MGINSSGGYFSGLAHKTNLKISLFPSFWVPSFRGERESLGHHIVNLTISKEKSTKKHYGQCVNIYKEKRVEKSRRPRRFCYSVVANIRTKDVLLLLELCLISRYAGSEQRPFPLHIHTIATLHRRMILFGSLENQLPIINIPRLKHSSHCPFDLCPPDVSDLTSDR